MVKNSLHSVQIVSQKVHTVGNGSIFRLFFSRNVLLQRKMSVYLRAEKPEWVMRINY